MWYDLILDIALIISFRNFINILVRGEKSLIKIVAD